MPSWGFLAYMHLKMNTKIIYIVRHGKSGWEYDSVADYDRPLMERGISSTTLLCKQLKMYPKPDLILSSPANRALHTATIIARGLNYNLNDLQINEGIYEAAPSTLINIIKSMPDTINKLMIVGHNPGFTQIASYFSGIKISELSTSECFMISFDITKWSDVSPENAKDEKHLVP